MELRVFIACFLTLACTLTSETNGNLKLEDKDVRKIYSDLLQNIVSVNEKRLNSIASLNKLQNYHIAKREQKNNVFTKRDPLAVLIFDDRKAYLRLKPTHSSQAKKNDVRNLQEDSEFELREGENPLNFTDLEKQMLRKKWNASCNKAANKHCQKACKKALKEACSDVSCRKSLKKKFKKYCKSSCKEHFMGDDDKDDDDYDYY